jgi:general secretion pathway protein A
LLGTYVQGKERVDRATLAQAAREVFYQGRRRSLVRPLLALLVLVLFAVLATRWYQLELGEPGTAALSATVEKPAVQAPAAGSVATAKEARQAAALPDLLEWPADQALVDSRALAYAALFRAWGADYRGGDACKQAEGMGLRCRSARGGLDELRELNRPAVLLLRDGQGREFHATLSALDAKSASFNLGAHTRTVAIGALAAQWSGQYTLLWRMPADARVNIHSGERGPGVAWLARQLAQAQGRTVEPGEAPLFDEALLRQVKQFQLAEGLIPDGVVGTRTLMRLAGVADKAAPKLLRKQGEK